MRSRTLRALTAAGLIGILLLVGYMWLSGDQAPEPAAVIPSEWNQLHVDEVTHRDQSVVRLVQSYKGEIPTRYPIQTFSYQLPYIDLSGAQALGCNQEIEERYGTLIRQSLEAMSRYEDPILEQLSYFSFIQGGILTLGIQRVDLDGSASEAYYTCDASTGNAVTVERLFQAVGITETPETALETAVQQAYTQRFGSPREASAAYTTALFRTQEELLPLTANRMHLNAEGKLVVAVRFYAPDGGSRFEELTLSGTPG